MLSLKNIVKEYRSGDTKVQALKGISIDFREHEFVAILGQSGCGKTTTLNIVGCISYSFCPFVDIIFFNTKNRSKTV